MKYVTNKKTGERYCLHCSSYNCICLPESTEYVDFSEEFSTRLEIKEHSNLPGNKATKLIFYKQKLPNGRIIKGGDELIVPIDKWVLGYFKGGSRQVIRLANNIINQSFKAD